MFNFISRLFSTYLLSWALLFSPLSFSQNNAANGGVMNQSQCAADSARQWDTTLNRCIYTVESQVEREEYNKCMEIEEADKRKACNDAYAQEKVGTLENEKESSMGMTLAGVNAALIAINWWVAEPGTGCTSRTMLMALGIGAVLAEAYFQLVSKKKLEELKEKYEDEEANEDPFASQVRSFEYLKDEQKAVKDYSKQRKMEYMVLAVGYLATAAYAIYESFQSVGTCGCIDSPKDRDKSYGNHLLNILFPEAVAKDDVKPKYSSGSPIDGLTLKDVGLTVAQVGHVENELKDMFAPHTSYIEKPNQSFPDQLINFLFPKAHALSLGSSTANAVVAGISSGLAFKLMKGAQEQMEEAEDNIKLIDKVLKKFKDQLGGYCPSGRDNLADPQCYCFEQTGKRNSERSNSETCQKFYAVLDANSNVEASDYGIGKAPAPGCVTVDRKFDKDCKCKKFKDGAGQNACMKSNFAQSTFNPELTSALKLPNTQTAIDSAFEGNTFGAELDGAELSKQLATNRRIRDQLTAKANKARKKNGDGSIPSTDKLAKAFLKKLQGKPAFQSVRGTSSNYAAGRPKAMRDLLDEAALKAGLKGNKGIYNKSKLNSGAKPKKKDRYRFNLDEAGGVKIQDGYMKEKFDYANNDISKDSGVSIFKIISSRYVTSGLKRLFEGEPKDESEEDKENK